MTKTQPYLVVIAGGSGTRFWPKSTSKRPKQFLAFGPPPQSNSSRSASLLAQTLARFHHLVPSQHQMIMTTEALKEVVEAENLEAEIFAEPEGRNTAPCIYWAARSIAEKDPKAVMLVMPADHYIAQPEKFTATVQSAIHWASQNDDLVTLGVRPSRPETGYGYLKTGGIIAKSQDGAEVKKVEAFVEKPNEAKAAEFLKSGNYLWNGGMFVWRAEVILRAFDQLMPEMDQAWKKSEGRVEKAYPHMPSTSIDYGIMEKAKNVVTFLLDCGWDDVGNWTSLEGLGDSLGLKQERNTLLSGELISIDSQYNVIDVQNRLVALLGVEDLIVVQQGDALLVAHKSRAQDIRRVVEEVKKKRPELA